MVENRVQKITDAAREHRNGLMGARTWPRPPTAAQPEPAETVPPELPRMRFRGTKATLRKLCKDFESLGGQGGLDDARLLRQMLAAGKIEFIPPRRPLPLPECRPTWAEDLAALRVAFPANEEGVVPSPYGPVQSVATRSCASSRPWVDAPAQAVRPISIRRIVAEAAEWLGRLKPCEEADAKQAGRFLVDDLERRLIPVDLAWMPADADANAGLLLTFLEARLSLMLMYQWKGSTRPLTFMPAIGGVFEIIALALQREGVGRATHHESAADMVRFFHEHLERFEQLQDERSHGLGSASGTDAMKVGAGDSRRPGDGIPPDDLM